MRFGICACAGGRVSLGFSVVGVFKSVFGMVFSLGVLPALFHFVSLFMFLSFSLFHSEGYRIRLSDPPVSGMPNYLRVNRVGPGQRIFITASPQFSLVAQNSECRPYA